MADMTLEQAIEHFKRALSYEQDGENASEYITSSDMRLVLSAAEKWAAWEWAGEEDEEMVAYLLAAYRAAQEGEKE